ncbi:MAG: hypothetical protein J0M12_08310 [Deltaproteobacteria bacterium]|nr:hypothetical protein [Deltaproteobacteria bacterium]
MNSNASLTSHFWVCAYPFVETTLFLVPALSPDAALASATSIELYDADGALSNEVELDFPAGQVGILELDSIMGGCKLESGLKHGHMLVRSPAGTSPYLRMHTREGAALIGEPAAFGADRSTFFPLTMDEGRSYYLTVVNHGKAQAALKCRLFCAKRSPETLISIPAFGSRVISLENEFAEYSAESGKQMQAYLRLSTKSETTLGVQLLERTEGKNEGGIFYAVS